MEGDGQEKVVNKLLSWMLVLMMRGGICLILAQKLKLQCSLAASFRTSPASPLSLIPHLFSWQPRALLSAGQPRAYRPSA